VADHGAQILADKEDTRMTVLNGVVEYIRPVDECTVMLSQQVVEKCELFDNAVLNRKRGEKVFTTGKLHVVVLAIDRSSV
jgi:hypothetical protein